MKVKKIISQWLISEGFDGLYNTGLECACGLENLIPCESDPSECLPGYRNPCDIEHCGYEESGCDDPGGYDFHIKRDKP